MQAKNQEGTNSEDSKLLKRITMILYLIALISIYNCLVRNDYNLFFALLGIVGVNLFMKNNSYVLFQGVFYTLIALIAFDILFLIINMKPWVFGTPHNNVYEKNKFLRICVYLTSIVSIALKGILLLIFNKLNDVDGYHNLQDVEETI